MKAIRIQEEDEVIIQIGRLGEGRPGPGPDWIRVETDAQGQLVAIRVLQASRHLPTDPSDDGVVGTKEAASLFGLKPSNFIRDLASRADFPPPIARLASTRVWHRADLEAYRRRNLCLTQTVGSTTVDDSQAPRENATMPTITDAPAKAHVRANVRALLPVVRARLAPYRPLRIILFGSQARGGATMDSDLDLLIVMPDGTDRRQVLVSMYDALADLPIGKDLAITTPTEVQRYGHLVGTILRPALEEGVVIYERA